MAKKSIRNLDIRDRRILVRVDFNVPLDNGRITDDRRIKAALPTIRYALEDNARIILMSHLGRPKGKVVEELRMNPVAERLRELLPGIAVKKSNEVVGDETSKLAGSLAGRQILLLENLRFDPGEKQNDEKFAERLRDLAEAYVNDAFATCHRKHASVFGVPQKFPASQRAVGLLVQRELEALSRLAQSAEHPLVLVMGGAKVEDKLGVIGSFAGRADSVLLGGAMAYTFMKAHGAGVGNSKVEEDKLGDVKQTLQKAGDKIHLPQDHIVARKIENAQDVQTAGGDIPEGLMGLDIGPETRETYRNIIANAATVVWNGPMGVFEQEPFQQGTRSLVKAMEETKAETYAGGGETAEAIEKFGDLQKFTHVSTGGGAFLAYLEQGSLPALELMDQV